VNEHTLQTDASTPGTDQGPAFAPIDEALEAFARGEILVVVDDEDRENEGDLIMAAEHVTPEKVAFFLHHTSGFICAPITSARAAELELRPMVEQNTESMRTAFLVSVDYRHGTSTGISAFDRSATVQALVDPSTRPGDLARPGHILPLEAREGGVLKRAGHTEATVDLARLSGLYPAGILCEIVDEKKMGMARQPELRRFARDHGLLMISIADLIRHRRRKEKLVRRIAEARIPTGWGDFDAYVYENVLDGEQHVAMVRGDVGGSEDVLVRVHSECLTGDVFGSMRCDCGVQLDAAMKMIAEAGVGVII
jgi:3,4-dihydroxy 2-butanone 4-phosphate synthase / GTP cyclohydrolase II